MKIKLLFVIPRMATGGAEVLTLYLLQRLDRGKFELHLVVFNSSGKLSGCVPNDVRVHDLMKKTRWDFFRISYKLARLIKSLSPDILYSRMWYATAVAGAAKTLCSKKLYFVANEEHNHKRDLLRNDIFGPLKKVFMDLFHKLPHKIIVPSRGVKFDICESYKISPDKVEVIYNSVDAARVAEMSREHEFSFNLPGGAPIISTLGRLVKRKGYDMLLKSFSRVSASVDCRLLIIGEGVESESLRRTAAEEGAADRVIFAGYQENPYSLIASSDIFVLSSLWEGFGNVIIKAMACGVAVISANCPYGPEEIITDGVDGILIPPGDENAMADAVLELLGNEPLRKRLAEAGRKRAEDFRVEKMVAEYERIFTEGAAYGWRKSSAGDSKSLKIRLINHENTCC